VEFLCFVIQDISPPPPAARRPLTSTHVLGTSPPPVSPPPAGENREETPGAGGSRSMAGQLCHRFPPTVHPRLPALGHPHPVPCPLTAAPLSWPMSWGPDFLSQVEPTLTTEPKRMSHCWTSRGHHSEAVPDFHLFVYLFIYFVVPEFELRACTLSHSISPFFVMAFSKIGSFHYLLMLASTCDPPDLCLLSSRNYRPEHQCLALSLLCTTWLTAFESFWNK
jgi:hypothetical protein